MGTRQQKNLAETAEIGTKLTEREIEMVSGAAGNTTHQAGTKPLEYLKITIREVIITSSS